MSDEPSTFRGECAGDPIALVESRYSGARHVDLDNLQGRTRLPLDRSRIMGARRADWRWPGSRAVHGDLALEPRRSPAASDRPIASPLMEQIPDGRHTPHVVIAIGLVAFGWIALGS